MAVKIKCYYEIIDYFISDRELKMPKSPKFTNILKGELWWIVKQSNEQKRKIVGIMQ